MADREEAVCRILVFSHFETLYGALPEDGKCRKLEEYLDMISRKEQWKPEFWLRYAWTLFWSQERVYKSPAVFFCFWRDQMVYCGRCDMGEQHCCTEGSTEAESSRRVSGGSECSGKIRGQCF